MRWLVLRCALFGLLASACSFDGGGSVGKDARADGSLLQDGSDAKLLDASGPDGAGPDGTAPDATQPDQDAGLIDAQGPDPDASSPDAAVPLPPLAAGLATLAGADAPGFVNGDREAVRFSNPVNLVALSNGDIVVCDFDNNALRRVTSDGETTTLVSNDLQFRRPFGIVRDGNTLYVQTDFTTGGTNTGALWQVDATTGAKSLLLNASGRVRGLGILSDGRLVMAEYQRHVVRIFDPSDSSVTDLAGLFDSAGDAIGTGSVARFDTPYDVLVLPGDIILVADFGNHRIKQITTAGEVTNYVGTGTAGNQNGTLAQATLNNPQGLAKDASGRIFITEPGNALVRMISAGQVSTLAGNGDPGWLDAADPLQGSLYGLEGSDVSSDGDYLYVADGTRGGAEPHHRIRRISLP